MKKCISCNETLTGHAKFCAACGVAQPVATESTAADPTVSTWLPPSAASPSPTAAPRSPNRYRVQVSAKILNWPRSCACCLENATAHLRAAASRTTGKKVQHTTTSWWEVPYCDVCLAHKAKFDKAQWAFAPFVFLGVIAWIGVSVLAERQSIGLLAGVALVLLGIWPYRKAIDSARAAMKPCCAAERAAVQYVGWHGTFHTFVFTNRDYLNHFLAANSRKTMSDIQLV
jgi:hypothetical protein